MQREEMSSPTMSTESVLLTAVIEAQEGRDVATCEIPNAFIQTDVQTEDSDGNRTIMKIRGTLVGILREMDQEYAEYVVKDGYQDVFYTSTVQRRYMVCLYLPCCFTKYYEVISSDRVLI
jgi:hypothetical protein